MIATNAFGMPLAATWLGFDAAPVHAPGGRDVTCAVRLIDRRTGRPLRLNGEALTVFTRHPEAAAAELLQGRDPALWEARIDPLATRETREPRSTGRARR